MHCVCFSVKLNLLWSILNNSTFRLRATVGGALRAPTDSETHVTLLPICYSMINRIDIEQILLSYKTQHCDMPRALWNPQTHPISSFLTFYSPALLLTDRNISCSAKAIYVNGSSVSWQTFAVWNWHCAARDRYIARIVPCYVLAACKLNLTICNNTCLLVANGEQMCVHVHVAEHTEVQENVYLNRACPLSPLSCPLPPNQTLPAADQ